MARPPWLDYVDYFLATALLLACGGDDVVSTSDATGPSGSSSSPSTGSATDPPSVDSDERGSESGDSGGQQDVTCQAGADSEQALADTQPDPRFQHTVSGDNGTFTDACDANGDLIEYVCEQLTECYDPPNPICESSQSGQVVPVPFDCAGACDDGTCPARCPEIGDVVEYLAVGETVELTNLTDGRRYQGALIYDNPSDAHDCAADPEVGDTTPVISLGLGGPWCTGAQAFNLGTGEPQECTYMCALLP